MARQNPPPLDLLREVLDHEILDADDVSCGMVDDIEFEAGADGLRVAAILVGPGAWGPRLPALLHWLAWKACGRALVRVPWEKVARIDEVIRLQTSAGALGLGRADREVNGWLHRKLRA
jgi:hypothetical protein